MLRRRKSRALYESCLFTTSLYLADKCRLRNTISLRLYRDTKYHRSLSLLILLKPYFLFLCLLFTRVEQLFQKKTPSNKFVAKFSAHTNSWWISTEKERSLTLWYNTSLCTNTSNFLSDLSQLVYPVDAKIPVWLQMLSSMSCRERFKAQMITLSIHTHTYIHNTYSLTANTLTLRSSDREKNGTLNGSCLLHIFLLVQKNKSSQSKFWRWKCYWIALQLLIW